MMDLEAHSQNMYGDSQILELPIDNIAYGDLLNTTNYPMSQREEDNNTLFGIPIHDSDFDMSPGFLQGISGSDGSLRLGANLDDLRVASQEIGNATGGGGGGDNKNSGLKVMAVKPKEEQKPDVNSAGTCRPPMGIPNEETITFDNWEGVFKFKVEPYIDQSKVAPKKGIYSAEQNKLFCQTDTAIPFKFVMDYSKIKNPTNLMVRAFLAYEDNDAIGQAVLRCSAHKEREKNLTDAAQAHRVDHMLRPANPMADMMYYKHPTTSRCYVLIPLKAPEPGTKFATRSFMFTCRNSCNILQLEGKSRKAISIVFCLYDQPTGAVLGRSYTHVRVCSAPSRDYNKECNPTTPNIIRKRKINDLDTGTLPTPKQVRFGQDGEIPLHGNVSTSSQLPGVTPERTVRSVVRASVRGKPEEDGVSSSQETVYSCDETENRINLRDLVKDMRWALKLKNSPNPVLRAFSNNVFHAMKLVQNITRSARGFDEQLRGKNEKSPDGGFHDIGQDQ